MSGGWAELDKFGCRCLRHSLSVDACGICCHLGIGSKRVH
jgi:hypothetical protein